MCTRIHTCWGGHKYAIELMCGKMTIWGVDSLLPCRFLGSNSGHQGVGKHFFLMNHHVGFLTAISTRLSRDNQLPQ